MAPRKKVQDIDASAVPLPVEGFDADALFDFDARPVIRGWPAKVRLPVAGGKVRIHELRLDVQYMTIEEGLELDAAIAKFTADGGRFGGPGDPMLDKLHGWSGIGQQGKGELAFTEANKARLLADPRVRQAVNGALVQVSMGIEEKNSETSRTAGSAPPNRSQRRAAGKALQTALKRPAKATA